jgi:hypothetical protein
MKPVIQALVLAEKIYTDLSGKKVIAGTFNGFQVKKITVPVQKAADGTERSLLLGGTDPGCPWLYISLTDVVDETEITVQFFDQTRNDIVFGQQLKIQCNDRLATVELVLPLPSMMQCASKAGTYSFDVIWSGEILASHRLVVSESNEESPRS